MADETPAPEIQINVKGVVISPLYNERLSHCCPLSSACYLGPNELKLQISIATDKTVLELKQAIAEKSDVEADRQRLIYSGVLSFISWIVVTAFYWGFLLQDVCWRQATRISREIFLIFAPWLVQDEEMLSVYKIQSSHTIHMVKGAARSNNSSSGSSSTPQPLPTMQAGQNPHDPLTQLNSHMGFGAMAGLNPFADMGLNPNDPNMVCVVMPSGTVVFTWVISDRFWYTDARNDEFTAIYAADVFAAVKSGHNGASHKFEPSLAGHGASSPWDFE
jgi:ubiquilin